MQKDLFFTKKTELRTKIISIVKRNFVHNKEIYIPGSKSITNRAVVLSGMCPHPIKLSGFLFAEDSYYGLLALQTLGFEIECSAKNVFIAPPKNFSISNLAKQGCRELLLDCNEIFLGKAGTLARFFPAVILNWEKTFPKSQSISVTLNGEEQLKKRPLADLIFALKKLGGNISSSFLPTTISSSDLQGECEISGEISGQFLSGLLLAAAGAKNHIQIHRIENLVQPDYIQITLKMIEEFGGYVSYTPDLKMFQVFPVEELGVDNYVIEADASTACYFICLAYLHNFNLIIRNLGSKTLQPDYKLVYLLQEMGANFLFYENETHILKSSSPSRKRDLNKIDCSLFSDQALTIAILALFGKEPVEVFGIGHIRHHESNRIVCLVKNLTSLGLRAEETNDGFVVYPLTKQCEDIVGVWETFQDHRFAMSGFLLASLCPNVRIKDPHVVEKTAPQFFELAHSLGFIVKEE